MRAAIAILAPLALLASVLRLYAVDPSSWMAESGVADGAATQPVRLRETLLYLAVSFAIVPVLAIAQHALFALAAGARQGLVFDARMSDVQAYAWLPAAMLALVLGGVVRFHAVRRRGPAVLRHWLGHLASGIPLHRWFAWMPRIGIAVGAFCVLMNLVAYHTYLTVSGTSVEFRRWRALEAIRRPVSELERIRVHAIRIVGMGIIHDRPFVELVFRDGTLIDTTYLVPPERTEELLAALARVSGAPVEHPEPPVQRPTSP